MKKKQLMKVIDNNSQVKAINDSNFIQENLARDLHDDISQYITTMSLYITKILTSNNLDVAYKAASEMNNINSEIKFSLKNLLEKLRKNSFSNYPEKIVNKEDYLRLICDWEDINSSIVLKYNVDIPGNIDSETLLQCYKILKEALTNISRHAQASHVSIYIGKSMDLFRMEVSDDGIGFDTNKHNKHSFGLLGIKERCKQIGAFITLNSTPRNGTNIKICLPLDSIHYE